jgi:hypothetical protein
VPDEKILIKKVDGFANYWIDTNGHVYNQYGLKLKRGTNIHGYPRVTLYNGKGKARFLLHRLVAGNFIGNIDGMDVHHKNKNRQDCRVANLEIWGRYDHMAEFHGWEKINEL